MILCNTPFPDTFLLQNILAGLPATFGAVFKGKKDIFGQKKGQKRTFLGKKKDKKRTKFDRTEASRVQLSVF